MKSLLALYLCLVLWLITVPTHGSTWDPDPWDPGLTFEFPDMLTNLYPSHVSTHHFRWEYSPEQPYSHQVGRIVEMEHFIHEAESRSVHATPEPSTMFLLASGLVGIAAIRRKRCGQKLEFS